jgi:hypothetical protein
MFYYVEPSSVFLKPSFTFYTKSKVLLKPGLESSVIPPYNSFFKNHIEIETSKLIECGRLAGTRHPANRQTIRLYRGCKQNLRQLWNNKVLRNDKCYELNGINNDVLVKFIYLK